MKEKKPRDKYASLRQQAEEILAKSPKQIGYSQENLKELVHELQVHQIELDAINEELLRSQGELQKSRDRYRDLYDNAPIGYINLDSHFIITDANTTFLNMVGRSKSEVSTRGFSLFLTGEMSVAWTA